MERIKVTMTEINRYKILSEVIGGKIPLVQASKMLKISYRQAIRLKQKLIINGFEGLLRKARKIPSNLKVTESLKKDIIRLRDELYWDFNIQHFKEKLELHNIQISHETLRQVLIKEARHEAKTKRRVYRKRRRMPKAGMLIQMDTSDHKWLGHIDERWHLIAMIDDASSEVPYAKFFPRDTTYSNMEVIRKAIGRKGIFTSLYVDKASHFTTTRQGGLHYEVAIEQNDTQIERALEELGITLITANSPQAKGRIERLFRTFQDRLIKEMRLHKIKDYDQANQFLHNTFLNWYNKRFTLDVDSVYSLVPENLNLNLIFSKKHIRTVSNDNVVQIEGHTIQLPPSMFKLSLAGHKITVAIAQNHKAYFLYQNNLVYETTLSKDTKTSKRKKRMDKILSEREYLEKPKNIHPPTLSCTEKKELVCC